MPMPYPPGFYGGPGAGMGAPGPAQPFPPNTGYFPGGPAPQGQYGPGAAMYPNAGQQFPHPQGHAGYGPPQPQPQPQQVSCASFLGYPLEYSVQTIWIGIQFCC